MTIRQHMLATFYNIKKQSRHFYNNTSTQTARNRQERYGYPITNEYTRTLSISSAFNGHHKIFPCHDLGVCVCVCVTLDWVNGFTYHLRLVTTNNYDTIANLHTL
jgi:hypothetical protein